MKVLRVIVIALWCALPVVVIAGLWAVTGCTSTYGNIVKSAIKGGVEAALGK